MEKVEIAGGTPAPRKTSSDKALEELEILPEHSL
jgi:hypothetical protein